MVVLKGWVCYEALDLSRKSLTSDTALIFSMCTLPETSQKTNPFRLKKATFLNSHGWTASVLPIFSLDLSKAVFTHAAQFRYVFTNWSFDQLHLGPVAQNQDKGLSQDILVILAQLIRNPVALKMDRGQEDMLWYKLPWRFILWSQPAPDQAKFQDLFNLIPNVSQQSPQMETNSYFTAHYTLLSHNQTHCHYLNVCDH